MVTNRMNGYFKITELEVWYLSNKKTQRDIIHHALS
jgi:hypothetical protein